MRKMYTSNTCHSTQQSTSIEIKPNSLCFNVEMPYQLFSPDWLSSVDGILPAGLLVLNSPFNSSVGFKSCITSPNLRFAYLEPSCWNLYTSETRRFQDRIFIKLDMNVYRYMKPRAQILVVWGQRLGHQMNLLQKLRKLCEHDRGRDCSPNLLDLVRMVVYTKYKTGHQF